MKKRRNELPFFRDPKFLIYTGILKIDQTLCQNMCCGALEAFSWRFFFIISSHDSVIYPNYHDGESFLLLTEIQAGIWDDNV